MVLSLAERIDRTTDELLMRGLDGELQEPVNHFDSEDLTFDYSLVHPRYHASISPEDEITLYKGAFRGYGKKSFLSLALSIGLVNHVGEIKEIIEGDDELLIKELFDLHTSYYRHTALLSATFNPQQAQVFASTYPFRRDEDKTIYRLKLKANRCVVDPYGTGGCGSSGEVFILGSIFSEEITAVKLINDDEHSELISPCGYYIRNHPDRNSTNRDVKDPDNWIVL